MSVGANVTFIANGYTLTKFKSLSFKANLEEIDATSLANNYRTYESGFRTGEMSINGIYEYDSVTADKFHNVFSAAFDAGTTNYLLASLGTVAVGSDAFVVNGCAIKYDLPMPLGQLIMANVEVRASDGINFGKWLVNAQLNSGTNNGTAVDNTAATTNGGVFQVHLYNNTASDVDVKVQHSTTGVGSWVDLTSVDNLSSAHTAGSATVAAGTTVNRYLRYVATITGGNTYLVSAAFARR